MAVISEPVEKVRVLVVGDDEDQRMLLTRYFEKAGCEVTAAESAEDAILAYSRWRPELAVIDLVPPGMNGGDLAAKLRVDRPQCAIAITSALDPADYPDADAVLPKPITGAQVRRLLRELVPRWGEK